MKGVPSDALSHRPGPGPRDADAGPPQTNLRDAGPIGVLQPRYDVVVVGAGLIGLATAFELARQGARVAVVEAGRPGSGASTVAAGMLAPGHEAKADPLLRELGLYSNRLWATFAAEVERASGVETGYVGHGIAVLAAEPAEAAELAHRASTGGGEDERGDGRNGGNGGNARIGGSGGNGGNGGNSGNGGIGGNSGIGGIAAPGPGRSETSEPSPSSLGTRPRGGSGEEDEGGHQDWHEAGAPFRPPLWLSRDDLPTHLSVFPRSWAPCTSPKGAMWTRWPPSVPWWLH